MKAIKTFLMTFLSIILILGISLGITYAVKPDLVKDWFNIESTQTEPPTEDTEQPGEDEELGTEEPGEETPLVKFSDFTFSNGNIVGYNGIGTEIVIPSSYSLEKISVGTFNNYEEIQSYFNNQEDYFYGFPNDYIVTTAHGTEYTLFKGYYLEDYSYNYDYPLTIENVNYIEGDDYAIKGIGSSAFILSLIHI